MQIVYQNQKHDETFIVRKDDSGNTFFSIKKEGQSAEINLGQADLEKGVYSVFCRLKDVKSINDRPCWGFNRHVLESSAKIKTLNIQSPGGIYDVVLDEIKKSKTFYLDKNDRYSDHIWIPLEAILLYESIPF